MPCALRTPHAANSCFISEPATWFSCPNPNIPLTFLSKHLLSLKNPAIVLTSRRAMTSPTHSCWSVRTAVTKPHRMSPTERINGLLTVLGATRPRSKYRKVSLPHSACYQSLGARTGMQASTSSFYKSHPTHKCGPSGPNRFFIGPTS